MDNSFGCSRGIRQSILKGHPLPSLKSNNKQTSTGAAGRGTGQQQQVNQQDNGDTSHQQQEEEEIENDLLLTAIQEIITEKYP